MTNKIFFPVIIVLVVLMSSCSRRARDEKAADQQLLQIQQLIEENNYQAALGSIDSLHRIYPRLVSKRRIAAAYRDTIIRRQSSALLAVSDSLLPLKIRQVDSLQKNFRYEKDDKYQEFGNFVYKTQITEQNINRNYLKCYVDDNADIYLISNVSGTKLNHTGVKVSAGDIFAQTDTTQSSNGVFHNFSDGGGYWESLTFKNENDGGIVQFISQHQSEKIKVNLFCKKNVSYILNDQDKKAIAATYELRLLKRDLKKLQNDMKAATIRVGQINLRYKH